MRYQSLQSHVQFLYLHVLLIEMFVEVGRRIRESGRTRMFQEKIIDRPKGKDAAFIEEYKRHCAKKAAKQVE